MTKVVLRSKAITTIQYLIVLVENRSNILRPIEDRTIQIDIFLGKTVWFKQVWKSALRLLRKKPRSKFIENVHVLYCTKSNLYNDVHCSIIRYQVSTFTFFSILFGKTRRHASQEIRLFSVSSNIANIFFWLHTVIDHTFIFVFQITKQDLL
jgi:hypothetical protein